MRFQASLSLVLTHALLAPIASAETTTLPGLPFFDTSLGVLQRAIVTIDPNGRAVGLSGFSTLPIPEHQHIVTIAPLNLLPRQVVFPPIPTDFASAGPRTGHSHFYNPPPVVEIFEGADLSYFIFNGGFIHPSGQFFNGGITTEAEGHLHNIGEYAIGNPGEITTTFEYTPSAVPEPATAALLWAATATTLVFRRRRG